MNAVKSIFLKQVADFNKNYSVSLMFILFPALAFIMSRFMGGEEGAVQIIMFAAMFVAGTPMTAISTTVAEDVEHKSLRFLVMAGVKPAQYLLGITLFVLALSALGLSFFAFMADLSGEMMLHFFALAMMGCFSSAFLGAGIGLFANNVQQASLIQTPVMMVLAFTPMLSMFNETLARIAEYIFVYQIFQAFLNPDADMTRAYIIVAANALALLGFFAAAYKKKGLRG